MKDAISHLQQALDGDPEDSVASSYLSVLLFESGDWQRATQLARNAVTLDHTDPVYRYRLGRMYAAKGAWHDALREFSQTLALEPECGQCHVAAAEAFEAVGQLRSAEMSLQV